jgi:hypothetical protein
MAKGVFKLPVNLNLTTQVEIKQFVKIKKRSNTTKNKNRFVIFSFEINM